MSALTPYIGANADTVSYLGPYYVQKYDTVPGLGA